MVGRFNVRPGDGDEQDWVVWDNAMNGHRGRCPTQAEAYKLAGDLELQYTVHGPRDQATVRLVSPPIPVDGWESRIGELDAWLNEGGTWLGRVRRPDGRVTFVEADAIRRAGGQTPGRASRGDAPGF